MVTHLPGTEDADKGFEELFLEKAEGVPFFIEEFVKSMKNLKASHWGRNAVPVCLPERAIDIELETLSVHNFRWPVNRGSGAKAR